ncbi:7-cyano-7-deazaguanine synthase [Mycobacterium sp. SA01]|uniref:7-cyano-7-deazaguanine synthase n=1 Tax=Mycobacterium sp. SA01 TaxID=3238820 RepID=UPI00351ACA4B
MSRVLLLSGGLDSAAVAALERPEHCLFLDYGQLPATAEHRAARQVAADLGLAFSALTVPLSTLGSGLMAGNGDATNPAGTSPEWWPYRNQLLITVAAAWGVLRSFDCVLIGTVNSDSARHADGTSEFVAVMDNLLSLQEGALRLRAPAARMDSAELVSAAGLPDAVIGWTHSCHRANLPCANCPGCRKHTEVLRKIGWLH